jgi:hypothetical protein
MDMRPGTYKDRFKQTIKTMKEKAPLIYQGVLIYQKHVRYPRSPEAFAGRAIRFFMHLLHKPKLWWYLFLNSHLNHYGGVINNGGEY